MPNPTLEQNAIEYATLCGISLNLKTPLGYGNDGKVWRSDSQTAVKAFERQDNYRREYECYQRLKKAAVRSILGLAVPQLVGFDARLLIVEMRLVTPPFLLDFGKAHLDRPPEFPVETMEEWEQHGRELFGDRWDTVTDVIRILRKYGIYYYDAKPGNINFGDDD